MFAESESKEQGGYPRLFWVPKMESRCANILTLNDDIVPDFFFVLSLTFLSVQKNQKGRTSQNQAGKKIMGKAGKERKRRKLENLQSIVVLDNEEDDIAFSDADGDDHDDLPIAIHALDILGQRIDLYRSKTMKGVRSALFPLIELQIKKSAFFENKAVSIIQDIAEATLSSSLNSLLRIASMLSSDVTRFLSFEMKEFRHALHPLVHFTQQKDKQVEPLPAHVGKSLLPPPTNNDMSLSVCTEQSYSQRISSLFRANQWTKALTALHSMRTESQERPKLGTIQRWVRECDLVRVSGEAGCENLSWLLLDATMRLQDSAKSGDNNCGGNGGGSSSSSGSGGSSGSNSSSSSNGSSNGSHDKGTDKQQQDKGCLDASGMIPHTAVVTRHPVFSSHHNNTTPHITTTNDNNNNAINSTTSNTTISNTINPVITTPTSTINTPTTTYTAEYIQSRVSVLAHVPGPHRRPPSANDLNIYQLAPNTMMFDHVAGTTAVGTAAVSSSSSSSTSTSTSSSSSSPRPSIPDPFRIDIPHLPSVFLMENILTPDDCQRLIALAEGIGKS